MGALSRSKWRPSPPCRTLPPFRLSRWRHTTGQTTLNGQSAIKPSLMLIVWSRIVSVIIIHLVNLERFHSYFSTINNILSRDNIELLIYFKLNSLKDNSIIMKSWNSLRCGFKLVSYLNNASMITSDEFYII